MLWKRTCRGGGEERRREDGKREGLKYHDGCSLGRKNNFCWGGGGSIDTLANEKIFKKMAAGRVYVRRALASDILSLCFSVCLFVRVT